MDTVTSSQNPFIKYLGKLKNRRFREREGKFLIEGARFVEEALKSGWPVESLICSGDFQESGRWAGIAAAAQRLAIRVIPVTGKLMKELASTETPQGVMALCGMKSWRVEDILNGRPGRGEGRNTLVVVADGVSDPGNLGTIIRSADAFGADGAVLTRGTVDPYNSKALRSTMGSVFHIPVVGGADPAEIYRGLSDKGVALLVGVPEGGVPVSRLDLSGPLALVVGSEAEGPSRELHSLPHEKATIPMPGGAESLNAAVAASIMLYEAARQRA
ncbi:MAG: RNA methyltransferase [Actinobacteria bacterium]|nr:RNA methyltransferase [Actinomycetota bacterium]